MWECVARYADGTEICKYIPYTEDDNIQSENEKVYELEECLISAHDDCIFYSVGYADEVFI